MNFADATTLIPVLPKTSEALPVASPMVCTSKTLEEKPTKDQVQDRHLTIE